MSQLQHQREQVSHLLGLSPRFAVSDFDENEVQATWIDYGIPVSVTALLEEYDGQKCIDAEYGLTISVDTESTDEPATLDGLEDALQERKDELMELFIQAYC